MRRAGFPDELDARTALRRFNQGLALCVITDPGQRTADYLRDRLDEKELRLKPTTMARYRTYTEQDLIPALDAIPLIDLTRQHLAVFVTTQLRRGRGKVTVHRILAALSCPHPLPPPAAVLPGLGTGTCRAAGSARGGGDDGAADSAAAPGVVS
ncbi:hypothetical protein ACFVYP_28430 [Kitasatospora sp. NPDC058201]|uniref:hypothetical protein n=1 Tax=Kitasatospora sp. NPDC058201 TaxID=3346379 RepID=UPI0036DF35D1